MMIRFAEMPLRTNNMRNNGTEKEKKKKNEKYARLNGVN